MTTTALVTLAQLVVVRFEFCCKTKPVEGAGHEIVSDCAPPTIALTVGNVLTKKFGAQVAKPPAVMTEIIPVVAPAGIAAVI